MAGSHATKARLVSSAGPEASPRVVQATAVAGNVKALLEFFRTNPTAAELNRGALVEPLVLSGLWFVAMLKTSEMPH